MVEWLGWRPELELSEIRDLKPRLRELEGQKLQRGILAWYTGAS